MWSVFNYTKRQGYCPVFTLFYNSPFMHKLFLFYSAVSLNLNVLPCIGPPI